MGRLGFIADDYSLLGFELDYRNKHWTDFRERLKKTLDKNEYRGYTILSNGERGVALNLPLLNIDNPIELALPYGNQGETYNIAEKKLYNYLKTISKNTIYVDNIDEYDLTLAFREEKSDEKIYLCNVYILDQVDRVIFVKSNKNSDLYKEIQYATQLLGKDNVEIISIGE